MVRSAARLLPALALLIGCAGRGGAPGTPLIPNQPMTAPRALSWGIGLRGAIAATVPKGHLSRTYSKSFCEVREKVCPIFFPGERAYHTSLSKTLTWSGRTFTVGAAPSSALGNFTFNQTVSTNSSSKHAFQAAQDYTDWNWTDLLTVTSGSLPHGTLASFKVTIAVKPGAMKAPCNADSDPFLEFYFASNGMAGGSNFIYGSCVSGKFLFYVDTPTKPGTVLVEYVSGGVGQTLNIGGGGEAQNTLCTEVGCIPQSSTLDGTVTYTIVSTTKGASFKTASGYKY